MNYKLKINKQVECRKDVLNMTKKFKMLLWISILVFSLVSTLSSFAGEPPKPDTDTSSDILSSSSSELGSDISDITLTSSSSGSDTE